MRAPAPSATSPEAAIRARSWMSSPKNGLFFSTILMPLYSGGLCDPVTATPASVPSSWAAKYIIGVGPQPIRFTSNPQATSPSTTAASRLGELSRPS